MHQYGEPGFCLLWAVNNALQEDVVKKDEIIEVLKKMDSKDKNRDWNYYLNETGIDIESFKKAIQVLYGIELRQTSRVSNTGRYIVIVKFPKYNHSISIVQGKVLDNRRKPVELKAVPWSRVEEVYEVHRD
jgi:hypothetical protein